MDKKIIIEKVAIDICRGVNSQKTRKKEDILEKDMLTNFGVLGLLTPLEISEAFYNGFFNNIEKETAEKVEKLKEEIYNTNWQYFWYGAGINKNEIMNEEICKRIDKIFKEKTE